MKVEEVGMCINAAGAAMLLIDAVRLSKQVTPTRIRLKIPTPGDENRIRLMDWISTMGCVLLLVGFLLQMFPIFARLAQAPQ